LLHGLPRRNAPHQFIIAEFGSPRTDASLKLELPSGVIVHLSSASQLGLLADLLKTLN
jgi:hypothetical protein